MSDPAFRHEHGLDDAEAARRLAVHGPNAMPDPVRRSGWRILLATLREPMFALLVAAAAIYLVVGDLLEGIFLAIAALMSIGLTVGQEFRSERALAALRSLAEPQARVVRAGRERRIAARLLVPGDVVSLGEGERVPADVALVAGFDVLADESTLTGESIPVAKTAGAAAETATMPPPGSDDPRFLFAGTLVVRGRGHARVLATGERTALGQIGKRLATIEETPTLLQQRTGAVVLRFGLVALVFCVVVAVLHAQAYGDRVAAMLAGITLAMAMLPEEFPMVLAVFLALGAWRLARHRVLVRRSAVVETLGAATLLCVDKTGTLTRNEMAVVAVVPHGGTDRRRLLRLAALASAADGFDPMDRATVAAARAEAALDVASMRLLRHRAPTPDEPLMTQVWAPAQGGTIRAAKGAPEAVLALSRADETMTRTILAEVDRLAEDGTRVLAVAAATAADVSGAESRAAGFEFAGLVGYADPLREDVPAALAEARRAGIAVAMITGDRPATARAIAHAAGLAVDGDPMTGDEVAALDDEALRLRARDVRVFARVTPEQKLRLVRAFMANGEVVAMTGDGVNDAPALEAAHIGIAMGQRGTDVAREAADIVLLDDDFPAIVGGVRLGRRIFRNLRRALIYVTAIHVPIAGLALLPLVAGLPPMMFPLNVVLLELVIDLVCALVFEAERSDRKAMEQPPRPISEPLFGWAHLVMGFAQGAVVLVAVFGLYAGLLAGNVPEAEARAAAFVALVIGNLSLALTDAGGSLLAALRRGHAIFWGIAGVASVVVAVALAVPVASAALRFETPAFAVLALAIGLGLFAGGWSGLIGPDRARRART